ncbi:carbohydrate ABC transporter membrane protein 2 (CUT1 family) [Trinickia symbiotica]|uniref:sn-glycerol-3-phosphate transport system permease protein UgpE n=1 Tax=Trinickia symbiotica TaxID=863227 RepID=A0A2N7X634_9BURK|nr:ABC transporter permease subunit [Trinickia symbiotica]PMS37213.1 ABC transporter permease [Trinickia symbiotica]PPK42718.1 carbohydrate ABC transporter membrane protein 2 (CUT1 family) [Trinickia symbiotica]
MVERHPVLRLVAYAVLLVGIAFALAPIYLAICAASVSNTSLLGEGIALVPGDRLIDNLHEVARRTDLGRMLFNSFVVSSVVVIGKLALSSITAYAVVYFRSRFRHVIFFGVLATLLLPVEVRIVPTYAVASDLFEPLKTILRATHLDTVLATLTGLQFTASLNLLDTYAGLTLPLVASATGTFLFRQFYQTVPAELSEAARLDGAGPVRFFFDILLPLSRANFAALGTIVFISTWKDYMWPLLMTSRQDMRTIVLGVASFVPTEASQAPEWSLMMAAALVGMAPPLVAIALMQRWFVKGVTGIGK